MDLPEGQLHCVFESERQQFDRLSDPARWRVQMPLRIQVGRLFRHRNKKLSNGIIPEIQEFNATSRVVREAQSNHVDHTGQLFLPQEIPEI